MQAIRVHQFGPPEVLKLEEVEAPQPASGQVVIQVEASSVAFGDILIRSGKYPFPLPYIPGWGAGGKIIQVGTEVDPAWLGRRIVASPNNNIGGYAEQVALDISKSCVIPTDLTTQKAVAIFSTGPTALAIVKAANIQPGEIVLVTAAAGAVGSSMVQLIKAAGAKMVIGAAGGEAKMTSIKEAGADLAVDYSQENWVEQIRQATEGKLVDIVIDALGGTIGQQTLQLLSQGRGRMALYGASSGNGFIIESAELIRRGLTVLGALGISIARSEEEMHGFAESVLADAAAGRLNPLVGQTYPLAQASEAHALIENRQNIGKILLIP